MRFDHSIDIDALPSSASGTCSATWETWPQRIETVETLELLTTAPIAIGTQVRLRQPRCCPRHVGGHGVGRDRPTFEWRQKASGVTNVAGHRVEALGTGRARLMLTVDAAGPACPAVRPAVQGT